jgi:hypothetical protein
MLPAGKLHMKYTSITNFAIFGCMLLVASLSAGAQTKPDKFLKYRNGDSVWSNFGWPVRFYIGDTRTNFRSWRNHLLQSDKEVQVLILKGIKTQRTSNWIGIPGLAATLYGLSIAAANNRSGGTSNPSRQRTGYIIASIGFASSIASIELNNKARRLYTNGERLFNNKVRQQSVEPITLELHAGPTQAGLVLRW